MTASTTAPSTLDTERTELLAELAEARQALIRSATGLDDDQARLTPTISTLCVWAG